MQSGLLWLMIMLNIHRTVQLILAATKDIKLIGQFSNEEEGISLCKQYSPYLVLMDVAMPIMDGIEATNDLKNIFPEIKILVSRIMPACLPSSGMIWRGYFTPFLVLVV